MLKPSLKMRKKPGLKKKMARDEAMFGKGMGVAKVTEQTNLAALAAAIGAARVQREYEEPDIAKGGKGAGLAMLVNQTIPREFY